MQRYVRGAGALRGCIRGCVSASAETWVCVLMPRALCPLCQIATTLFLHTHTT